MRAAIVGTGGIARVHRRVIRELGGEVVGVCGRSLASAQSFGAGAAYDNLAAMLRAEKPDVLHVCTPNHLHAEQVQAGFAAGAHVVCEKPMATSSDEARHMIDAAGKAGRVGGITYNYRGYPLVAHLKQRVAAGDFGALRRVGGCYLSDDGYDPRKYMWHFTPGSVGPGYALMDIGVHWLDLVEHVTGQRIRELSAMLSTHQKKRVWRGGEGQGPRPPGASDPDGGVPVEVDVEDQADLLIRLDCGAAGAATISCVSVGHPNTIVLSVDGSEKGFHWNQQEPNVFRERSTEGELVRQRSPGLMEPGSAWMTTLPGGHAEGYLDAFRNVVSQIWAGMRGERSGFPTFADGLRGIELIEAAVRSARERRSVDVS
ncbi:Gfo/Idh/MocA family protein [Mesorhizobium sp. IMUNJ 23232]|uniref:Gfo/Idh/MocA family protein n=1 Tax=Mesorhizobium sp. IMUNJ 23232 TaxID=3376064 RepID=UPI0037B45EB1